MISFLSVLNVMFSRFIYVVSCIGFILSFLHSSIPLCEYPTVRLSTRLLMDTEFFSLGLSWIQLLWAFSSNMFCEHEHSFLLDKYLGRELLGHRIGMYLILLETPNSFPERLRLFHTPTSRCESSLCSTPSPALGTAVFLLFGVLVDIMVHVFYFWLQK